MLSKKVFDEKMVDDIIIKMKYKESDVTQYCFLIFSSKEEHIKIPIDCIENILHDKYNYEVKRLDQYLKSEDSHYKELTELLKGCSFAVIILDGLRPNVVFEYGILKGLNKPCIVLLEENAKVDVKNYFLNPDEVEVDNPELDMDKHVSDIKDRYYIRYNKNNPEEIREKIEGEYLKKKGDIELEFVHMIFPDKEIVEKELKSEIKKLLGILEKKKTELTDEDKRLFDTIRHKIKQIVKKYNLKLSKLYYLTICQILMKFEKYQEALDTINEIFDEESPDIRVIVTRTHILDIMENLNEALNTINIGSKKFPNSETIWHHKGLILEKMERDDEALLCYRKGSQMEQNCSGIHFQYGILLYEKKKYPEALEQFNKALNIDSTNDEYLVWKARSIENLGKKEDAKKILEEAICYNEKNADAWFTLGQITIDRKEAIKFFDKAILIHPDHGGALCSKAAELSNLGNTDEALELFKNVPDSCQRSEICVLRQLNIARTLEKSGKDEDALEYVDNVLKTHKTNSDAFCMKAHLSLKLGKKNEAEKYIGLTLESLESNPEDAVYWYNASCVLFKLNEVDESIDTLKKAIDTLKKAIDLDPSIKQLIETDTDFDDVRKMEEFKRIFS